MVMALRNIFMVRAALVSLMLVLATAIIGCGDSNILEGFGDENSREAQTEAALMAMDNGDYPSAITILSALVQSYPGDAHLLQYLGSAYSGLAGLDTLSMLDVLDQLDDSGESGNIDMVGLVLGNDSGLLTGAQVAEKLGHIEDAIAAINRIAAPNDDQTVQLGVLSLTHLSLTIADLIMDDMGVDEVTLTEDGIHTLYGSDSADFSSASADAMSAIDQDMANIAEATDTLNALSTENNDIAQDFNDFQTSLDQNGDGLVATTELETYVNNL